MSVLDQIWINATITITASIQPESYFNRDVLVFLKAIILSLLSLGVLRAGNKLVFSMGSCGLTTGQVPLLENYLYIQSSGLFHFLSRLRSDPCQCSSLLCCCACVEFFRFCVMREAATVIRTGYVIPPSGRDSVYDSGGS